MIALFGVAPELRQPQAAMQQWCRSAELRRSGRQVSRMSVHDGETPTAPPVTMGGGQRVPTELDRAFDLVVRTTAERLAARGFKRRGSILRTIRENMSGLLQFQRSTKSTRDRIVFTVNVAVVCGDLLSARVPLRTATSMDAHAGDRLGHLSTGVFDQWWTLDASTDVHCLANEIANAVESSALPYIVQYMTPDALIAAWEAGRHLGATESQRQDRLARLKAKRNDANP